MNNKLALVPLLLLAACVAELDAPDPITTGNLESSPPGDPVKPTDPPEPVGPQISRVTWHWSGCDPSAGVLALSLTVNVELADPATNKDAFVIYGGATGCDKFVGNGITTLCYPVATAALRELTVTASAGAVTSAGDTISTPIVDCKDDEWVAPNAAK